MTVLFGYTLFFSDNTIYSIKIITYVRKGRISQLETLMQVLHVVLVSVGSIIVLFGLAKLIGNKQISQLNMFDYINGITIGSIAAEMATSLESDFLLPLTAMIIYAAAACLLTVLSQRSVKARRFLNGKSVILYDNGKLYPDNLKRSKIDLGEFLTQCRVKGYFDLSQVQSVFFESNGSLSVLPKAEYRPLTPSDENITLPEERSPINVIVSGEVIDENLCSCGLDRKWLENRLRSQGIKNTADVFLAYVNNGELTSYLRITGSENTPHEDIFG